MAGRSARVANEYADTDIADGGTPSDAGAAIDPADIDGSSRGDSGGSSGGGSGGEQFDPNIHVSPDKRNGDGSYTRKRGRKAGSGGKRNNAQKSAADLGTSIEALSKTLVMVHIGLANITATPELVIDKPEGDMLAAASANMLAQFDLTPDPKTQAIIGLIMACGAVYGPRVIMYRMRKAQEEKEKEPGIAGVYDANNMAAGTTTFSSN